MNNRTIKLSSIVVVLSLTVTILLMPTCPVSANDDSGLSKLDFREVVRDSKDRVFPAVVFVKCVVQSHEKGKKQSQEISGSGVLISSKGEFLTNWHVVDKSVEIRCLLQNGKSYYAEVIGTDKDLDLALVKLILDDKSEKLPFAKLGDSEKVNEGDFVMAMGAPWGLARSVSIGIISCTKRYMQRNSEYSLWLQTDAAISPGNSGGPLVSTDGQIIGINTMAYFYGGDTGFAVPSSTIKTILPRLRKFGNANWAWTGLELQAIRDFNKNVFFEGTNGVIVANTEEGSPARHANIMDGDRILSVNGQPISGLTEEKLPDIRRMIGFLPIDKPATFKIEREKKEITVKLTPREKGKVEGEELDCPRWDLTVKAINQFDNKDLYFFKKEGVFIFGIKYPGNASNSRFGHQDIILEIDGEKVATLDDVKKSHKRSLKNIDSKPRIMFKIMRNGMTRQIILDFSRDHERE